MVPAPAPGFRWPWPAIFASPAEPQNLRRLLPALLVSGDFGGSWFLSKIVGTAKARELYYFATGFTGEQAESMGVVNRAVTADELDSVASQWARQLAEGPSVAHGYMKSNFNLAEHASLQDVLDQEAQNMARSFRTADHAEAARAFIEKRTPKFEGK